MNNLLDRKGFALPMMIFLMVIVSLLVVAMARMLSAGSALTNMGLLGTQAHWSAQAANEWAAYQINRNGSCPTAPGNFTINGFRIAFSCSATAYAEASANGQIFTVSSTAEWGTDPAQMDYVSRTLEVVLDVQ